MIGGRGCIEQLAGVDPLSFRIAVAWQGLTPTVESGIPCAQGLYGGSGFRRVVAKVVSIGNGAP